MAAAGHWPSLPPPRHSRRLLWPGPCWPRADFHQLTNEETIGLLRQTWAERSSKVAAVPAAPSQRPIEVPPLGLKGDLCVPPVPRGLILFAHGSGSSRLSPHNVAVAQALNGRGFATLLLDLLTETEARDRRNVFDIALLADRLLEAVLWINGEPDVADLRLGLFGASTGAGAALMAAAELDGRISAVVSRGGRPDLVGRALSRVTTPTLLVVGGEDHHVITLNRQALAAMTCEKLLRIVPRAGHLFEEPGTLEAMTELASAWFEHYLTEPAHSAPAGSAPPVQPSDPVRHGRYPLAAATTPRRPHPISPPFRTDVKRLWRGLTLRRYQFFLVLP